MTTELEKRAKEYAEARAGKRPEIDSEIALPISFLGLWLRDVRWLEEGFIAGVKAERARRLKELEEQLVLAMNKHILPVSKIQAIVEGDE